MHGSSGGGKLDLRRRLILPNSDRGQRHHDEGGH